MKELINIMQLIDFILLIVLTCLICEFINPIDIAMTKWFFEASKQTELEPYKTMLLAISDWFHLGQSLIDGSIIVTANIRGLIKPISIAIYLIIILVTNLFMFIGPKLMRKKNK